MLCAKFLDYDYQMTSKQDMCVKVAGHPACSAVCLRVENEWEICNVDLSLPSKSMAPQI